MLAQVPIPILPKATAVAARLQGRKLFVEQPVDRPPRENVAGIAPVVDLRPEGHGVTEVVASRGALRRDEVTEVLDEDERVVSGHQDPLQVFGHRVSNLVKSRAEQREGRLDGDLLDAVGIVAQLVAVETQLVAVTAPSFLDGLRAFDSLRKEEARHVHLPLEKLGLVDLGFHFF